LTFSKNEVSGSDPITANVELKNSGNMAADEVVQVYLSRPGVAGAPIRALAAFQRVNLKPGESQTLLPK